MVQNTSFTKFLRPRFFNYSFIEIIFSLFLSISLVFFSIIKKEENNFFRNYLIDFLRPISIIISIPLIQIGEIVDQIQNIFELEKKNAELLKTIKQNEKELGEMYHLMIENEKLKALSNLKAPPSSSSIVSRIIFDPSNFASSNVYIDVGRKDNVKLNNPVFNKNGIIGRIIKVQENTAEVLLISDTKSFLPVVSSDSKQNFFVNGNENKLEIQHLENKNSLIDGELILSTSTSGYFKEGIKVGIVKKEKDEIFIVPLAKKSDSTYVKVLIYNFERTQPIF